MKIQTFETKGNRSSEKKNWPIFPVLASMEKLKEHFISFHKAFWQLLWNL